jgi:hypothetical protein
MNKILGLLMIVVVLLNVPALADEESVNLTIDLADAQYKYGDHKAALATLQQAADNETDQKIQEKLRSLRSSLKEASDDGFIGLGPANIERVKRIHENLSTVHGGVSVEDLEWAFYGAARPYLLDDFRRWIEREQSPGGQLERTLGITDPDRKLAFHIRYDPLKAQAVLRVARLLRGRFEVSTKDLQFAADDEFLKPLYVAYMKAGGPDPETQSKALADEAKVRAEKAEKERAKETSLKEKMAAAYAGRYKDDAGVEQALAELPAMEATLSSKQTQLEALLNRIDSANPAGKLALAQLQKKRSKLESEIGDLKEEIRIRTLISEVWKKPATEGRAKAAK